MKTIKSQLQTVGIVSLLAGVGACGGSGGGSSAPAHTPDPQAPVGGAQGMMRPAQSDQELGRSLRSGLSQSGHVAGGQVLLTADGAPLAASEGESSAGNFTSTNLQEVGVDEADIVKYDGDILYLVQRGTSDVVVFESDASESVAADEIGIALPQHPARIHLLRTDVAQAAVEEQSVIELDGADLYVSGLYLHEDQSGKQLVAIADNGAYVPWATFADDVYWREGKTSVNLWDVSDPTQPGSPWQLEIEGSLLDSRRIGDKLYLVTRYTPSVDGVVIYPENDEQVSANQQLIDNTPLADLLPNYRINGGADNELLAAQDCYVPNPDFDAAQPAHAGGGLVTITEVDLVSPGQLKSVCMNAQVGGFYASQQAIYLTAALADNLTQVHKVALAAEGPVYRGSGEIPGYIGTANPAFLMSESGSDLRVVSSLFDNQPGAVPELEISVAESDPRGPHRLTILRENASGTALEPLSSLPNDAQPAPIGKPGEQVYAARFIGDRAYVVTFEIIDPLYVIDLADPAAPRIAGELEIPGFSTLLQPLGENLLLGVGHEVPAEAEGLTQGVKVALFDVANLGDPVELGSEVIGKRGSYSPALNNHHAITVQEVEQGYRVALPVVRNATAGEYTGDTADWNAWYEWSDSGLYKFDIQPATGAFTLRDALLIEQRTEEQPWPQYELYNSRSVLHDNALFFTHGARVWAQHW